MTHEELQRLADMLNGHVGKFLKPAKLEVNNDYLIAKDVPDIGLIAPSMIHTFLLASKIVFTEIRTHKRTIHVFFNCPPPVEETMKDA